MAAHSIIVEWTPPSTSASPFCWWIFPLQSSDHLHCRLPLFRLFSNGLHFITSRVPMSPVFIPIFTAQFHFSIHVLNICSYSYSCSLGAWCLGFVVYWNLWIIFLWSAQLGLCAICEYQGNGVMETFWYYWYDNHVGFKTVFYLSKRLYSSC